MGNQSDQRTDQRDLPLIMVVDDDRTTRLLLRRVMEQEGYQVMEACNGHECLEAYLHYQPEVILMDALMPQMDGFACCSALQQLPNSDRTSVLMITGLEDPESVNQAFAVGAIDYINKPIHLAVLRQRVRRLLQASRAMAELRQQTERERLLRTITSQIRQSLNLDDILTTTALEVRHFLQADRVLIYQLGLHGDGLVVAESVAQEWKPLLGDITPYDYLEACWEMSVGRGIAAIDEMTQGNLDLKVEALLLSHEAKAALLVPIVQESERWGFLMIHQCEQPRRWRGFEMEALQQLVTQVTLAIRQSNLYQQLEEANQRLHHLAISDGLTQVANRRCFDERLEAEWKRLEREKAPLSLIMCDIDFFKPFNDTYGHQPGDACLQLVAQTLRLTAQRAADLVARYGGEEFAIILPNTPLSGALQVAELMRDRVKDLKIEHQGSKVAPHVTLSLGVACQIPEETASAMDLIAAADRALYQAKSEGRDRVCWSRDASESATQTN